MARLTFISLVASALLSSSVQALKASSSSTASTTKSESEERPIAKILKLLREMKTQMEAETDDDKAVHEKYQCWCKKEEEEKSAISTKQSAEMKKQDSAAKGAFSESQKKNEKRVKVYEEFTAKQKGLEELRQKCMDEKSEFSKDDQEIEKSIIATRNAITVLKKHNFLQDSSGMKKSTVARKALLAVSQSKGVLKLAQTNSEGLITLENFLGLNDEAAPESTKAASFLQLHQSPGFGSYANSSGQIFGILSQMLEDLTRDQSAAAKAEKERVKACTESDAAMTSEIAALDSTLSGLDARLGELAQIEADAKEDYAAAKEAYGNAVEFLGKLKSQCEENDSNFKSRSASRQEELAALADTINILDNDDAFKKLGTLGSTSDSSFIQLGKIGYKSRSNNKSKNDVINSELKRSAYESLDKFAKKDARTYLVQYLIKSMSTAVDKGALKKVQEKIDILVKELQVKQNEEIAMRSECIDDFNQLGLDMEAKQRDKSTQEEEISTLTDELELLHSNIEELEDDTKTLQKEAAEAGESRKSENLEFQKVVKEHNEVQEILKKAIDRMNAAYSDMKVKYALNQQQPGADFVAVENTDTTPGSGPAAFTNEGKTEKNSKGGNKVINMLKEVLSDSEKTESDATKTESDAQNAYESFINETERALAKNAKAIAQKTKRAGQAEGLKSDTEEMLRATGKAIFELTEEDKAIHGRCDFVMNNFDARQTARSNEMAALTQAKQLLGGMSA